MMTNSPGQTTSTKHPAPRISAVHRLLHPPTFPLTQSRSGIADLLTLLLALAVLTFGIGDYALYEPHEGHFAGVAREMLLRGDWVTPTLNGSPYLNKPPLLYWLLAMSQGLFGMTEFAARLPVALAGWGGVIIVWKWARELWHPMAGRLAAGLLSLSVGWFIFTHQILIDLPLGSLLIALNYCLWRLAWEPQNWRYRLGFSGLMGCCFLLKGPIGPIYLLIACIGLTIQRRNWSLFSKFRLPLGLGIMAAIVLPWVILVEQANPGFWHYFLINEHLKRAADVRFPPDYTVSKTTIAGYLGMAAVWAMPLTLLLPVTAIATWHTWQQGASRAAALADRRRSEGILLLVIASLCPLLLFLPLSSRLIYYSLPMLPPLAILTAGGVWQWRQHWQLQRMVWGLWLMALGAAVIALAGWVPQFKPLLPPEFRGGAITQVLTTIALAIGSSLVFAGFCWRQARWRFVGFWLTVALLSSYAPIPMGLRVMQNTRSAKTLIKTAKARLSPETLWIFEGSRELGAAGAMSYYLDGGRLQTMPLDSARLGWESVGPNTGYRTILVLADGGTQRLLPNFPGDFPAYALSKQQMQTLWQSDRPVVFVTDFLRHPQDASDPITRNLPHPTHPPLLKIGPRHLYGNQTAQRVWGK
jgi:4-amino-4-deoxy-L-arabinose transferase-like glycosyltransferase